MPATNFKANKHPSRRRVTALKPDGTMREFRLQRLCNELRAGAGFFYFLSADRGEEHAGLFAQSVDELMRNHAGSNRRLAIDKIEITGRRDDARCRFVRFDLAEEFYIAIICLSL